MRRVTRRGFLKATAAAGAYAAFSGVASAYPFSRVRGANDDIRIAVIGFRSKGAQHIEVFHGIEGVRIVALCDADRDILAAEAAKFRERKENVDTHVDLRDVLEREDIDAVVTATPNHWHAAITIWACQAGKDVYVEKPVSHSLAEGRKMVEAARQYNRIVQAGTQGRSDDGAIAPFEYIREGNLGKILYAKSIVYKLRESIGKVNGPQPIPDSVDYDLWSGPAPMLPLMRQNLHYDWHWQWHTGDGELANNGVHFLDMCRWAIGQDKLPPRALSIGGRLGYIDDGETPNTQITIFDYEPAPIISEIRGLPRAKGYPAMDHQKGTSYGVIIQCEEGYFSGGRGGGWVYANNGKKVKQFTGDGGGTHQANFIKALRSRKVSDLNCDILEGHLSTSLCHIGNISHRIGKEQPVERIKEAVKSNTLASETLDRLLEHLAANEVDPAKTPLTLGAPVEMDVEAERFVGQTGAEANKLLKTSYREPFVVAEEV